MEGQYVDEINNLRMVKRACIDFIDEEVVVVNQSTFSRRL